MLALKRDVGEYVIIKPKDKPEIRVYVSRLRENGVILGFEADDDVAIYRPELVARGKEWNRK